MVEQRSSSGRTAVEHGRAGLRFRVLGPLEVVRPDGEVVAVRRAKPGRLLAALIVHVGEPVTVDALVDVVWPAGPPASAAKTLQTYVGQVRSVLEPDREPGETSGALRTGHGGYRLAAAPTDVDAGRFTELVLRAGQLVASDPSAADRLFEGALGLWRGTPYGDFGSDLFARPEVRRLEELRLTALEGRVDAQLALGRAAAVVPTLQDLVRRHPLREHLWAQLMQALYRSGRQAEALRTWTSARDMLARDLGVEPGPELELLHQQILSHDVPDVQVQIPSGVPTETTAPSQVNRPGPRHRLLTVLHVGGPEGWESAAPEAVAATVERYGGAVIDEVPGSVVAVFGTPVAHDDDAERAVRCASALHRWSGTAATPVRIGVASGVADVEDTAAGSSVRGKPVEHARGLARTAEMGSSVVDEATMRRSSHAAQYAPGGQPGTWSATGIEKGAPGRPLSSTPFVGRAPELALLDNLWEITLRAARPHLVTITGTTGVGKSRILDEVGRRLRERGARVLTGRSYPFGDAVFGAVAQVVTGLVGVDQATAGRARRSRIDEWLTGFLPPEEQQRRSDHLVTLLSVLGDFAELRDTTVESLRRLLEMVAERQPTAILLDDLHLAHPELVNLVAALVRRSRAAPLLLIVAARPHFLDDTPTWGAGAQAATRLPLDVLPPADARDLAVAVSGDMAGGRAAAAEPSALEVAGGNPLFIEEVVRGGLGDPDGSQRLPPTVRTAIMARLDTLPEGERRTLVDAAIVGQRFWSGAVAALADAPSGQIEAAIDALELKELVVRQSESPVRGETAYAFRHDLFADVASATIPEKLRRSKHLAVARWLDDRGEAVPPALLAHHWRATGDAGLAAASLVAAGDAADQGWNRGRAASLFRHAEDIVGEGDPEHARRIRMKRAVALQAWAHAVLDVGRSGGGDPRAAPRQ